jgi:hypothetical protein
MPSEPSVNERIAREVMGWRKPAKGEVVKDIFLGPGCWITVETEDDLQTIGDYKLPDFAHSLDACAIAEAEIERRGLMIEYEKALILNSSCPGTPWVWKLRAYLIRLTPAQRTAAMVAVIEASR